MIIVPISLHEKYFNNKNLKNIIESDFIKYACFFNEIAANEHDSILIIIVDTLHRFSPDLRIIRNLDEKDAYDYASNVGKELEKSLEIICKENKINAEIQHWQKSCIPSFPFNFKGNQLFEKNLDETIKNYLSMRDQFKDTWKEAYKLSEEYVLEECIELLEWIYKYKKFCIAYLGEPNLAIQYICSHLKEFISNSELYQVDFIKTLAKYYFYTNNDIEKAHVHPHLSTDLLGLFKKLDHYEFRLHDRNQSTLIMLCSLYFKFLRPLLLDDEFTRNNLTKSKLAHIHLRIGIVLEAVAAAKAMDTKKPDEFKNYYNMSESALNKAMQIAKIDKKSHKRLSQINLNLFGVLSRWKHCIFSYLYNLQHHQRNANEMQANLKTFIKQHLKKTVLEDFIKDATNPSYSRFKAERILLQLMCYKMPYPKSAEKQFIEAETLLFESLKTAPEWSKSYRYLDLALLYLIKSTFYSNRYDIQQGLIYCNYVTADYKNIRWSDPRNSDVKIASLLAKNLSNAMILSKDKGENKKNLTDMHKSSM